VASDDLARDAGAFAASPWWNAGEATRPTILAAAASAFAPLLTKGTSAVIIVGLNTSLIARPAHLAPGAAVTATGDLAAALAAQPCDAVATELAGSTNH
jgi:hypothetical protein